LPINLSTVNGPANPAKTDVFAAEQGLLTILESKVPEINQLVTIVPSTRCSATNATTNRRRVAGRYALLMLGILGATARLIAQEPPVHYLHQGVMPPGAIGSRQLQRGGPVSGFFQPVEIKAPRGALVSLAVANRFDEARSAPRKAGFLIGGVYRLRVTNIRMAEGEEVFPTIEVIDRLYAPIDQQRRFAIPIELTEEDLKLALGGKFVTRVIYLEDPHNALPISEDPQTQNWFEAKPGQDPLAIADVLGRPVAILRIGGRLPDLADYQDPKFFYGSPPFVPLAADPVLMSRTNTNTSTPATESAPPMNPSPQMNSVPKTNSAPRLKTAAVYVKPRKVQPTSATSQPTTETLPPVGDRVKESPSASYRIPTAEGPQS
jgi:hypothetical protein